MNSSKRYFLRFSFSLFILLIASCATKRIEIHYYEGSLLDRLRSLESVKSIKAAFSIEFDKGEGITLNGDGVLSLSEDALDLQVYSMGFLVAEVNADRTGVRSNPSVNKNRLIMLVDGLRNSFFWWSIDGYDIEDKGNNYIIMNSWKRVTVDKKTMMPLNQRIDLEEDNQLEVFYYEPIEINGFVFPSRIRIELSRYAVNLRIRDLRVMN